MTIAHGGSRLSLNKMPSPLPDGMILFPLDGRVQDTKNEIPILMNTTTIRDDIAKFTASFAVEDGTTNISNNADSANLKATSFVTDESIQKVDFSGATNSYGGWYFSVNHIYLLNETWTFSFTAENKTGQAKTLQFWGSTGGLGDVILPPYSKQRYYKILKFGADVTSIRIENKNWMSVSKEVMLYHFQAEAKDHPTSYVVGSRDMGNLKYNISDLSIRDAGCISCWIYNSESMVNNRYTDGTQNNQYIIKLGSSSVDWYQNAISLWIQNTTPRKFKFWSASGTTADHIESLSTVDQYGGIGTWNHFVLQWDKNGLPSGSKKELYINGVLQSSNNTTALAVSPLTYLHLGQWNDSGGLMPSTLYEQLAIHPSKGFSAAEIGNWYNSQAPFYDTNDQLFFY